MRTAAMEVAAHGDALLNTLQPTVKTKRYVPMNSHRYRAGALLSPISIQENKF
jgi:hypothetical protein